MASITGKDGYVTKQVSGVDTLVAGIREWSVDYAVDMVDVTSFAITGVTHKESMPVLMASTGSFSGNHTDGDTGLDVGTAYNITLAAHSGRAYYGSAYITSKTPSIVVDGEATMTYNFQFTGKVYVLGANLVVNGGFTADSDWTKGTDWTIAAGVASVDGQGAAGDLEATVDPLSATTEYWTQFKVSAFTDGTIKFYIGTTASAYSRGATGTYTEIITSGADGSLLFEPSVSATMSIDDVIVREVLN